MFTLKPHTADIRILIKAKNLKNMIKDSILGIRKILRPFGINKQKTKVRKIIFNPQEEFFLIELLNNILFLINKNKEIYSPTKIIEKSSTKMILFLKGEKIKGFRKDIKAITYHNFKIEKEKNNILKTEIVLDI